MTRPAELLVAHALASVRARLADLGVRACADQLYYATNRAVLPFGRGPGFLRPRLVGRATFDRLLAASDGPAPVPALLPEPGGATDVPDLLDYGLPRVLVCQTDAIAAMLLANDLHMEAATVVLGASQVRDGLPEPLRPAVGAVHVLHDATAAGAEWGRDLGVRLAVPVHVLGLSFAQARAAHLVRAAGGGAEVAAVPPATLLRVLRRALSTSTNQAEVRLRGRSELGFLTWPEVVR
jgi:hypothetical protein